MVFPTPRGALPQTEPDPLLLHLRPGHTVQLPPAAAVSRPPTGPRPAQAAARSRPPRLGRMLSVTPPRPRPPAVLPAGIR